MENRNSNVANGLSNIAICFGKMENEISMIENTQMLFVFCFHFVKMNTVEVAN
ncbi:MAG: hypothetical protein WCJ03_10985 [Bacteroidales bacterium]